MSEHTATAPEWVRDGEPIWYSPHSVAGGRKYAGVVDGEPFRCGPTWCVSLREMEPAYRDGERCYVNAAACESLNRRGPYMSRDAQRHEATLRKRIAELEAANEKLRAFANACLENTGHIDGSDVEGWAIQHGLVRQTTFDPERHGSEYAEELGMEPGDPWNEPTEVLHV